MSLRFPLWLSILALLASVSAALRIPSPLSDFAPPNPINNTNISPQVPAGHFPNLAFSPWPARPYLIPLVARFGFPDLVTFFVQPFFGTHRISVPKLQDFIKEFRDNIEQEYPIPGYVPRHARQSIVNIESYTTWTIEIDEGILGHRLPTEWALLALDELARQLGSHGPADLLFSVKEASATYIYGGLSIREFGISSLNPTLANRSAVFHTS